MPAAQVILQLQSQIAPQIAGAVQGYTALNAAQQKAELGATRYAQSLQKVALADAKTAVEEQRLAVQTANVAKAESQAELAALRLANAQEKAANGSSLSAQFADGLRSGLLGIVGPAALATAAIASLKNVADLTVAGETTNRVARSFESLSQQAGTTGDAILGALRKASGGEISDLNLQLATDKGLLLGVADSAADFASIMEIARDRAAKMGITTTQAFDDITTGIGRESPRILDNLGIIVDLDAAHQTYATSVGKTVEQLTKAERIEALRNAVIAQGKGTLDASVTAINDETNAYARLAVAVENAKNRLGAYLATDTQRTAGAAAAILSIDGTTASYQKAGAAVVNASGDLTRYLNALNPVTTSTNLVSAVNATAIDKFNELAGTSIPNTALSVNGLTELWNQFTGAVKSTPSRVPNSDRLKDDLIQIAGAATQAAAAIRSIPGANPNQRAHINDTSPSVGGGVGGLGDRFTKGFDTVAQASRKADQEAARLADLRVQNQLINAKTSAQKIAILRAQLAKATTDIERQTIQNQIDQEKQAGGGRVSAAESTALKLNDIARSSGDDRARIERENQEKLRDAQEDFDVRRVRSQEDFEEKRRRLLARGQRAQAAQLAADFSKEQRRAQEDFDRQTRRTVRNNQEALGDQSTRVGNQVESINARTAARGGTAQALPSAGSSGGTSSSLPSAAPAVGSTPLMIPITFNLDGKKVGEALWTAYLEQKIDGEIAVSLQAIGAPNSGQAGLTGGG